MVHQHEYGFFCVALVSNLITQVLVNPINQTMRCYQFSSFLRYFAGVSPVTFGAAVEFVILPGIVLVGILDALVALVALLDVAFEELSAD